MARAWAMFFLCILCAPVLAKLPNVFNNALILEPTSRPARVPVARDAVQHLLVTGAWKRPAEGDAVALHDGSTKIWAKASLNENGSAKCPAGGTVFTVVHAEAERVAILHTRGCSTVYVNGEPRAGDPYGAGYWRIPVAIRKGDNEFLFLGARGEVAATLSEPAAPAYVDLADCTLPDVVVGDDMVLAMGLTVVNATQQPQTELVVNVTAADGTGQNIWSNFTQPFRVEPLTLRKIAVFASVPNQRQAGSLRLAVKLLAKTTPVHETHLDLRVRSPGENHRRTFVSDTDGSVQYYAVNPARPAEGSAERPAIVLSLHGASVEAVSQADAYSGKAWANIICPTNRRPFGFDWEDWGRLDALEALADAKKRYAHDLSRVYLTGHSMGGHGTWSLACLRPDLFAAAAPSAGWISFASYTGSPRPENPTAVEELLFRASGASQTLGMVKNLAPLGVFILHGDADDNVPVAQARNMREELAKFHKDFAWHEEPGAGHWWENSDEPGAECLDWPAIFDLFARRRIPPNAEVRHVDFTTVNPRVSSTMRWLTIEAQQKPLVASTAVIQCDPGKRRFVGTTTNVLRLSLDATHLAPGEPIAVNLDGAAIASIPWPAGGKAFLARNGDTWSVASPPSRTFKGPHRAGPFKDVFRHRVCLIYATNGTPEENSLAYAKARYDAETFAYRGNGSFELRPDTAFDPSQELDRNVVLYGNADTNRLWKPLLGSGPVQVEKSKVVVGAKEIRGDDLACIFIRPRPGSETALVGAVACTGAAGMRTAERLPFFLSGVGFPDLLVVSPAILTGGSGAVNGAGYFGDDWSVESGEFAWKE